MKSPALTILACATALFVTATTASAEIVCNDDGDCWHTKRHDYGPGLKLHVHPDDWKWGDHEHAKYRFREHDGHGYWRGGVWIGL